MEQFSQRTDLAAESRTLAMSKVSGEVEGVDFEEGAIKSTSYQKLVVTSDVGAQAIGKPVGTYYTVEIESVLRRESETFSETASALSEIIKNVMGPKSDNSCTLIVGLGNRDITPDIIGPMCADSILVTRHLKEHAPKDFEFFTPVAAICPGVLGTTGIESADYVKWVCDSLKPEHVIVIDALAARNLERLCRTVQITDTGITPGSGVGNTRSALNKEILGVPVTAIGVPTVVDIRSLLLDMGDGKLSNEAVSANEMIVTPRNIDSEVVCASRVVAYAINLALHSGLKIEDIDMMVG